MCHTLKYVDEVETFLNTTIGMDIYAYMSGRMKDEIQKENTDFESEGNGVCFADYH